MSNGTQGRDAQALGAAPLVTSPTGIAQPAGRLSGGWQLLAHLLLAAMPVFGLAYAFNVSAYMGYALWSEQAAMVILGLGLGATYLLVPRVRGAPADGSGRPPWADVLLAAVAMGLCLYTAVRYESLVATGYVGAGLFHYFNLALALGTILLLLEALRRLTGWTMVILIAVCMLYAAVATRMPGAFQGTTPQFDFFLGYLHLDSAGIVGTPLSVVVSTVIAYVLLGNALFRFGGGQMFLDLALAGMGRFRGGPAKSAALASSMFGSISGSAVANVATTGIVTIPLMRRVGYRPEQAAAIEAVASTGGQLLPPIMGAAAFIMAEFLGIPYAEVALAALLPAVLFYVALLAQIHLHAARNGLRPLTKAERPDAGATLRKFWPFLVPVIILLLLLFIWRWRPEQAAFASLIGVLIAAIYVGDKPVNLSSLFGLLQSTGRSLLEIVNITAAAGIIVGILSLTGLSFSLGLAITEAAGSTLILLLLITAATAIVFGMGMPTTAVYVLMATLVAPALVLAGVEPLAAHLFVLYFGCLSMITPPVCLASFTAASMAGAPFMRTGWQSLRFGLVAFVVPFMFVASPDMLLQGDDLLASGRAFMTGIMGSLLFAVAIEGFLFRHINVLQRLLVALAALLLIVPDGPGSRVLAGVATDLFGLILALCLVAWLWWRARQTEAVTA